MYKLTFALIFLIFSRTFADSDKLSCFPLLYQTGQLYSSDRVTATGAGLGAGVRLQWNDHYIAQPGISILWANGNAIESQLAFGYQVGSKWQPQILAVTGLLWGSRIEILDEEGNRPDIPVWKVGLRLVPLNFRSSEGFVSALEIGAGIGPDQGRYMEITLLSAGINW